MKKSTRRKFIKASGLGIAASGLASIPMAASADPINSKNLPEDLTILFQGDSITDAGRDRSRYYANEPNGMGRGYVFQTVARIKGELPDNKWRIYNRGISGNKVFQLANRWEDDCLQIKPDVLSILIGVNDFWHSLRDYDGTVETYETDLRKLLDRTKAALPEVKLIIGEPFAVKGGTAISDRWFSDFPAYQKVAAKIARDYGAAFIPYQKVFDKALKKAPASYWCPDGVHPSMAGAFLMKDALIEAFETLF